MEPSPYPETVVFVRHAQSQGNVLTVAERAALTIGTASYDLTDVGRAQAACTHDWMQEYFPNPDRLLSSYYLRPLATGGICYPGMPIRQDERLAESDRGVYTILGSEGVQREMPWEILRKNRDGLYHYRPPGGENWPDVLRRIREFRTSIRNRYPGKTIVVFGHGFWILLWQMLHEQWTIEETVERYLSDRIVANASVLIYRGMVDESSGRHVLRHNPETDYIVPWEGRVTP